MSSIGGTYEDRPIPLVTIDGYDYLLSGSNKLDCKPFVEDSFNSVAEEIMGDNLLTQISEPKKHKHKHHHKRHRLSHENTQVSEDHGALNKTHVENKTVNATSGQ